MVEVLPQSLILPGDILCYEGHSLISTLIRFKTWSDHISHVEMANSPVSALASRDGKGVATYGIDLDPKRLYAVYRSRFPLDMTAVRTLHVKCVGQKYDVWGLFRFFTWGKQSLDKQFCSEYVVRLLREGVHAKEQNFDPFFNFCDADLIPPGHLPYSPGLWCVCQREKDLKYYVPESLAS